MENNYEAFEKAELILRHLNGELNPQEEARFNEWLNQNPENRQLLNSFQNEQTLNEKLAFFSDLDETKAWENISSQTIESTVVPIRPKVAVWQYAAALVLLLLSVVVVYRGLAPVQEAAVVAVAPANKISPPILPGLDKAKLTLADGTEVILEDLENGTVREENGIRVEKQNGQLVYQIIQSDLNTPVSYNTISTPRGGKYEIKLPDGTQVWLNAASSIRFPTAFKEKERTVELTGEGYFEVARRKDQPFILKANETTIEVLGTHFNVSAYADGNNTKTTLFEGAVKVSNRTGDKLLQPGQQAIVGTAIEIKAVDTEEVIAWKQGFFHFNKTSLAAIIPDLERWYNVEFVLPGRLAKKHFTGIISRNTDISTVLKMLEMSGGIHFKTEERRIMVLPENE